MSIQALAWVLEHSEADGYDRLILLAIANHADAAGGVAWPSVARIATEARVDRATVYRAVQRLVELGELDVNRGGGRGRTNVYTLKRLPAATVRTSETVAAGDKTVAAGDKNGRSRATQTVSNRQEPFRARARTRPGPATTDPDGSSPAVITLCFNCGNTPPACLCDHFYD